MCWLYEQYQLYMQYVGCKCNTCYTCNMLVVNAISVVYAMRQLYMQYICCKVISLLYIQNVCYICSILIAYLVYNVYSMMVEHC